jgi:hypothetical protein
MRIVAYSDGERIRSIVIYEADLNDCLTRLREDGYLVVSERRMPAPEADQPGHFPQREVDERR